MILYLGLISILGTVALAQDCPSGYTMFNTNCYAYVDHKMNWPDAESTCAALGGFLAEVFSAQENTFLQNMSRSHGSHAIWLGGDDLLEEGKWSWARSGIAISEFTDWYPGQPERHSGHHEDCLEMDFEDFNGQWNDENCDHKKASICQRLLF